MNTGVLNLAWADAFVAGLAAAGLRHAVIAPGARSAPLATALLRRPEIACEVINDERVAAFFALGQARATGRPGAVVCTSGTAAANLLPAVVEANLAGMPLLALTADRPAEAHGWGANQTVDQTRLYGSHVRAFHALPTPDAGIAQYDRYLRTLAARMIEETLSPLPGPVHANLPFREPLLPDRIPPPPALPEPIRIVAPTHVFVDARDLAPRFSGRRGVIVCGEMSAMPAAAALASGLAMLAERLGAPILAEPLSNLRYGTHDRSRILTRQARFLRAPEAFRPEWVLRFGRFPVSRTVQGWLSTLDGCDAVLVAPPGLWPDPLHASATILRATPESVVDALLAGTLDAAPAEWLDNWRRAEAAAELRDDAALFEGTVARALLRALPDGAHCFVGNSLAIRAMDAFGGTSDRRITLHGNRGASGIDGNLATAAGIAAASGAPTAALLGDQAALHDCGALSAIARHRVVAVVMDNGGGGIFDHLPLARALPQEMLERGWRAHQHVDFRALAQAHGLGYSQVAKREELPAALASAFAAGTGHLVRIVIDPRASRTAFAA